MGAAKEGLPSGIFTPSAPTWNTQPSRASVRAQLLQAGDMVPAFVAGAYRARGQRVRAAR
jgi:hypothetical protein